MVTIRVSTHEDAPRLFAIWRSSVEATHDFLSPEDLVAISELVRDTYLPSAEFWLAVDGDDRPLAFMGLSEAHIDALFVSADNRGRGIGRALIAQALSLAGPLSVDVNAQNLQAVDFYLRQGFHETGRSERDSDGRPYPLLHMRMV